MKAIKMTLVTLLLSLGISSTANAGLITTDFSITASVGNTIVSNDFPLTGSTVVSAGPEFSQSASLVFLSSGFEQTFSGIVGFDLTDDTITVSFSGTAQGINLAFNFSNMVWDSPIIFTGIELVSQNCSTGDFGCSGIASFNTPSSAANSVSNMGMALFGFQPGLSFTQTYRLLTEVDSSVPPNTDIPEPSMIFLLLISLIGFGFNRVSKNK